MKQLLFAIGMIVILASCGKNPPPPVGFDGFYRAEVDMKVTPQYNQLGNNLGVDAYGDMLIIRVNSSSCKSCGFFDTVYISNVVPNPKYGYLGLGSTEFEIVDQAVNCCDTVKGYGYFFPDTKGEMWVNISVTKMGTFTVTNTGTFVKTHD